MKNLYRIYVMLCVAALSSAMDKPDSNWANQPNDEGVPPLLDAAARCDEKKVEQLLAAGADKNYVINQGGIGSALMVALSNECSEVAIELMDAGEDVHFATPDGMTALLVAADKGLGGPVIQKLIDKGAHLKHRNEDGNTALLLAAKKANPSAIESLLKAKVDQHEINAERDNALTIAAKANINPFWTFKALSLLINAGTSINHENKAGETPLTIAQKRTDETQKDEIVKLLEGSGLAQALSNGFFWGVIEAVHPDLLNLSKQENFEINDLLIMATELGLHKKVSELLKRGADPLTQTKIERDTPLNFAARQGYLECVKELLAVKGTEQVTITNARGFRALDMAAANNSHTSIPALVNAGAEVNRCPSPRPDDSSKKKGEYPYLPPLLIAHYEKYDTTVKVLIECGAKDIGN